jgi:protein prenyltransferase alpha subunit repeat containing protein 1
MYVGLPPEALLYSPCVLLDGHLGVPQRALYAAYSYASTIWASSTPILSVSSVLLLANPAHRTALNARKRALLDKILQGDDELRFMALLLSGIKDASKQDMLWHHRRWVLSRLYPPPATSPTPTNGLDESFFAPSREVWRSEMTLINRACELYPRNYHAWTHRTLCMRSIVRGPQLADLFEEEVTFIQRWIEQHVSDASAVHHIAQVASLSTFKFESGLESSHELSDGPLSLHVHATSLVQSYPNHEALWTYLRFAIALLPTAKSSEARSGVMKEFTRLWPMEKDVPQNGGDENMSNPVQWNMERFRTWCERDQSRHLLVE